MKTYFRFIAAAVLILFTSTILSAHWQVAQNDSEKNKKPIARRNEPLPPQQIQLVTKFLDKHHPELTEVLKSLESAQPKKHQQAMRELFRTKQRLETLQKRDPERYALELKSWNCQSRIQLLAARLHMDKSEKLAEQLRNLLKQQQSLKLQMLKQDHKRAAERVAKVEKQLEKMEANSDRIIEQQFQWLTKPRKK